MPDLHAVAVVHLQAQRIPPVGIRPPEQLLRGTRDYLHQEYRRPAMPESLALVDTLRADGVPALVSGAGPTVLAFTDAAGAAGLAARRPDGWEAHHLTIDRDGARIE